MSQSYLEFSATIDNITPAEAAWWQTEYERVQAAQEKDGVDGYDAWDDIDNCNDFSFEGPEKTCIWFHSEECGDVEKVAHIAQRFLKEFRPDDSFVMTWAETCSKPAVDSAGGGAVFVTAKEQKWMSGHTWINEQLASHKQALEKAKDSA